MERLKTREKLLSHPPEGLAMMHTLGLAWESGKPGTPIAVCDHDRRLMAETGVLLLLHAVVSLCCRARSQEGPDIQHG